MELIDHIILITVATSALILTLAFRSGAAKGKAGEKPYETLTDETARIANRIHLNTIEMSVAFLPLLWVAALYSVTILAVALGWVWILARIGYAYAYTKKPASRAAFFVLNLLCVVGLMGVTLYGLI